MTALIIPQTAIKGFCSPRSNAKRSCDAVLQSRSSTAGLGGMPNGYGI